MDDEACPLNENIKTLEDSLRYFDLYNNLQQLEISIDDVKKNANKKEEHEEHFKEFDKEMQKLSLKYHPDKVRNKGGTEKDITTAEEFQTVLNATRRTLKFLNSTFLEDITIDHKFGFYMNLSINCTEKEIKDCVYEVKIKISKLSQINQQYIIPDIRKFLIESKNCVNSYPNNRANFARYRDLVLFHLDCCIKSFEKLCTECEKIEKDCKKSKKGENMHSVIKAMASDRKRDLKMIKLLEENAKLSLRKKYRYFSPEEVIDPYFVLPLVYYTNVIVMCSVMMRKKTFWNSSSETVPHCNASLCDLFCPYFLASYYSGNKNYEDIVLGIMCQGQNFQICSKSQLSEENVTVKFNEVIRDISESMEQKFKVEEYTDAQTLVSSTSDLSNCLSMMKQCKKKSEELSKDIKDLQRQKNNSFDDFEE